MGGVTTYFHWDAFGNLVQENDTQNNSIAYYYDPSGNPVGFIRNGDVNQKYICHTNMRGDIVSITDGTDTIQAQYSYDPWGTPTSYTGTMTQPLRYAGYYYDEETGLYYLKSRYYSPATGRFTTKDGYGYVRYEDPKTLNLYVYCGNNPVNFNDPTGSSWVTDAVEGLVNWLDGLLGDAGDGVSEGGKALSDCYDSLPSIFGGLKYAFTETGQYLTSSQAITAYLQTGGTVILVCGGPAKEGLPFLSSELRFAATYVKGKTYVYAYEANMVAENVADMIDSGTPPSTPGGFIWETGSIIYNRLKR